MIEPIPSWTLLRKLQRRQRRDGLARRQIKSAFKNMHFYISLPSGFEQPPCLCHLTELLFISLAPRRLSRTPLLLSVIYTSGQTPLIYCSVSPEIPKNPGALSAFDRLTLKVGQTKLCPAATTKKKQLNGANIGKY